MSEFDYILVGGGLQNALIALAVLHACPQARIALIEKNPRLGGNRTWSMHALDAPAHAHAWMEPLFVCRWDSYEVAFSSYRRVLDRAYYTISSDRLDRVVRERLSQHHGCCIFAGCKASRVEQDRVELDQNRGVLCAKSVIDARGLQQGKSIHYTGYQKFLGLEVLLDRDWKINRPLIMDARVEQTDGYRFMYVLPYSDRHILVENTCFSNQAGLDQHALQLQIERYLARQGVGINKIFRQEAGTLPMPWEKIEPQIHAHDPLTAGLQGGWFHPATGYCIPSACRLACVVAADAPNPPNRQKIGQLIRKLSVQMRFARRLNRMLFTWIEPKKRVAIFERFYRLPPDTIARFYALDTSFLDRARILVDRPPFARWFRIPGEGNPHVT